MDNRDSDTIINNLTNKNMLAGLLTTAVTRSSQNTPQLCRPEWASGNQNKRCEKSPGKLKWSL